ncbi:hypothetical protein [Dietzia maris]|uniref:Uncharacterized protein n=1 Tax=Dietzia maris TaxID=37915 RepID=A0ABT8H3B3_9ACTN|nr:hypothetical protein [Dietzia maris]MCZ4539231.1 hypothetical protein [Dietzia maris]MDN4506923.1 hypothetical protein [Dietzia maris]
MTTTDPTTAGDAMTTSIPDTITTDDEYAERRFWRDLLDRILAALGRGEEVDAEELADVRSKAAAEEDVETARRSAHERRRTRKAQDAAAARADEIAAGINPDALADGYERMRVAYEEYLRTVEEVAGGCRPHNAAVAALARACRDAGAPTVQPLDARAAEGDYVVMADGGRAWPTWNGIRYSPIAVEGERLPHNADRSKRRQALDRLRGRAT